MRNLLLLLIYLPTNILAGNDNIHFGGRSAGMGHASVTLSDVWSSHHNQAGLGWLTKVEAGVFAQNRFLVKEMNYMGFAYAHPVKSGAFALSFTNFGYSQYGESKLGLAYGMKFSERITGGVQINYHNTRVGNNYGSASVLSSEMGLQAKLTSKLELGLHLFNPTQAKLNDFNDERIPTIMRLGIAYTFSNKVFITLEAEKDIDFPANFKAGIEYKANDKIYLRGGIGASPTAATFGVGVYHKGLKFDLASSYHQVLGFIPEVSLTYVFEKN
ncbi:MAG: hypothetical protein H8D53_04035 [Bacteroidetes bacterium]|nr:hypothetical protein [Bacteroidota bacterium]